MNIQIIPKIFKNIFEGFKNIFRKPKRKKVKNKVPNDDSLYFETVGDILRNIDSTFKSLKNPDFSNDLTRETIKALKKIGPTVLNDVGEWEQNAEFVSLKKLPTFIFLALNDNLDYEKDTVYPKFFFATKMRKNNIRCSHIKGTTYQGGFSYNFENKVIWNPFYFVVIENKIEIIKKMPVNSFQKIYSKGEKHPNYIPKIGWEKQKNLTTWGDDRKESYEKILSDTADVCTVFFNIWNARQKYWRVSIKKKKRRMTFLLKQQDPKILFKNRDVIALTPTGQKKKIIHYVSEHTRIRKGKKINIKPHIRGLRNFNWFGSKCHILAPGFHKMNMDNFTATGIEMKKNEINPEMCDLQEVAKILVNSEEKQ